METIIDQLFNKYSEDYFQIKKDEDINQQFIPGETKRAVNKSNFTMAVGEALKKSGSDFDGIFVVEEDLYNEMKEVLKICRNVVPKETELYQRLRKY